jgi:GntR family transcriptional regulator
MAKQLDVRIDRGSPVPLYHQLSEQLTGAITSGALQPGDAFENEIALADRLGLSRPTVRRAIQELVAQGLLLRRRGLGTTVANRQIHRRAELTSLFDDLKREGAADPRTTVLSHGIVEDERAATAMGLAAGTPLLSLVRLRHAGDLPLAILRNWLPPAHSDISREELEREGLYALLRDRGVRPVVAHQSIGARPPTPAERKYLDLRSSQPVLTMTRSAFDAVGNAVEYGDHCYRAQDYTIDVMIDER